MRSGNSKYNKLMEVFWLTIVLLVVVIWLLCMVKKMFWDDLEMKDSVKKRIKRKMDVDD